MLLLPIPLAVYRMLFITMGTHLLPFDIYFISILLLCLLVTSVAYLKFFLIVQNHQQQIQAHELSHNFGQPSHRLCQVQEIGNLYPLYCDSFLSRLPANDCHFDGSCFFGKVSSDHENFNRVNCTDISVFIS